GHAEHQSIKEDHSIVIGRGRIPKERNRGERKQNYGEARLGRDKSREDAGKIRTHTEQRVEHKKAGKANQKRKEQKHRHFQRRIEHLEQPFASNPAECSHQRSVTEPAKKKRDQRVAPLS